MNSNDSHDASSSHSSGDLHSRAYIAMLILIGVLIAGIFVMFYHYFRWVLRRARKAENSNTMRDTTLSGNIVAVPMFVPRTVAVPVSNSVALIYDKSSQSIYDNDPPPSYESIFPSDVIVQSSLRH
ncbi:hypothetical protein Ocin01_00691 [Orchesella cincta]|uniref:Uncharacterized protein n=1 Tax=Orchesella cincta TaxID=48709 RepID=A0A1D2NM05_ORCCI|nr:hypothetical protein Ocin01_00691 [Orchesella cincta]